MNRIVLTVSMIVHMFLLSLLFMGSGIDNAKLRSSSLSYPSTVPVDISVVSQVSCAPVSRPKSTGLGSDHAQGKRSISQKKMTTVPRQKKKPLPKKMGRPATKTIPLKKNSTFVKKKAIHQKNKDLVGDLIEKTEQEEQKKKQSAIQKGRSIKESFLKNLEDQQGGAAQTPVTDPGSDSDYGAPEVGALSIGMLDKVQKMLEKEWTVPFTLKGGLLKVVVTLHMNKDGTIGKASVLDRHSTTKHPSYPVARNSAMKALQRFYRTPLPLPPAYYDQWKVFEFAFVREENDR